MTGSSDYNNVKPLTLRGFLKNPVRDAILVVWLVSLDFTFFRENSQIGDPIDVFACVMSIGFGWACADYFKKRE